MKLNQGFLSVFDGKKAFKHLEFMESLGPRIPGSEAHRKLEEYIEETGSKTKAKFYKQKYSFDFNGENTSFANLIYIFEGAEHNKKRILLGTHYDSRIIADNETDFDLKNKPIPGINDGGSGTAVMIEFMEILERNPPKDDICIAFFDAEDVGNIENHNFSEGAEYFAEHFKEFVPDEVIVIDMIGGENASYQIDYEAFETEESKKILLKIWEIGIGLDCPQFRSNTKFEGSYFICDHTPFVRRNIPAMLLIDINYKWWHTQNDTCEHCSHESLTSAANVLLFYIYRLYELFEN